MKCGLKIVAVCVMTLLGGMCAWASSGSIGEASFMAAVPAAGMAADRALGSPADQGMEMAADVVEVEQRVLLEGVEPIVGVPEELMIEYEGTREYYPIKSVTSLGEWWSGDFEFPILFYVYDAGYYRLGEVRVPKRDGDPGLADYEPALLQVMGLKGEDYVIEEVVWDGAAYDNDEGINCRNALAKGRKRVEDYEVVYGGAVKRDGEILPGEPVKTLTMEEGADPIASQADVPGPDSSLWQVVKRLLVISIAIWAAALLLVLLILAVSMVKRWVAESRKGS